MSSKLVILQKRIDSLIGVMGTQGAIEFLDLIIGEGEKRKRISSFISSTASNHFGVPLEDLYSDKKANSVTARCRMICYKLHKDFLSYSIRRTGRVYNKKENTVMIALRKMNEAIDDMKLDPELHENYVIVKNSVLKFVKYVPIEEDETQK